jgi:hypothetical protein
MIIIFAVGTLSQKPPISYMIHPVSERKRSTVCSINNKNITLRKKVGGRMQAWAILEAL